MYENHKPSNKVSAESQMNLKCNILSHCLGSSDVKDWDLIYALCMERENIYIYILLYILFIILLLTGYKIV